MAGLQVMEDTFSSQGFHVLGFYSNDFGNQGGTDGQIDSCSGKYGVTFPQFTVDHVVTAPVEPVFEWILSQPNPGPATPIEPQWNFHKYLISKTGELVGHWDTPTYPGDDPNDPNDAFDTSAIVVAVRAELAK